MHRVTQATNQPRSVHRRVDGALHRGATQSCTGLELIALERPMHLIGTGNQPMLLEVIRVLGFAVIRKIVRAGTEDMPHMPHRPSNQR